MIAVRKTQHKNKQVTFIKIQACLSKSFSHMQFENRYGVMTVSCKPITPNEFVENIKEKAESSGKVNQTLQIAVTFSVLQHATFGGRTITEYNTKTQSVK